MGLFDFFRNKGKSTDKDRDKGLKYDQYPEIANDLQMAEAGDADAQFRLGLYFYEWKHMDLPESCSWIKKAAEQGHADAMYFYYTHRHDFAREGLLEAEENSPDMFCWLKKAAEHGQAEAQFKMGDYYCLGGQYVGKDTAKGIEFYEKAANQGHYKSANRLAEMYENGELVKRDPMKSIYWYEKLVDIFENGKETSGMPRSYFDYFKLEELRDKLQDMYFSNSDQLDKDTLYRLAKPIRGMSKNAKDYYKCASMLKMAADKGHPEALRDMSEAYGRGFFSYPKNHVKAHFYSKRYEQLRGYSVLPYSVEALNEYEMAAVQMLLSVEDTSIVSAEDSYKLVVKTTAPDLVSLDEIKRQRGIEDAFWEDGVLQLKGDEINIKLMRLALKYLLLDDWYLRPEERTVRIIRYSNGDIYEGDFTEYKHYGSTIRGYYGYGRYTWKNGDVYEGDYRFKREGYGTFRYANGDVYKGSWKEDKQHGKGTMRYANGDVYEGEWEDGKQNGFGKMCHADGRIKEGLWEDGVYNGSDKEDESAIKLCIIGARGVGKTTLTAAITQVAHKRMDGNPPGMNIYEVSSTDPGSVSRVSNKASGKADEESREWIQFRTENRTYKLAYWPNNLQENDLIAVEMVDCDGAIVVVDVSEGVLDRTRKLIRLARDVAAIPIAAVIFNKCDLVSDPELIEIEEVDIWEALEAHDYSDVPIFKMSAEDVCEGWGSDSDDTLMQLFSHLDQFDFEAAKALVDDSYVGEAAADSFAKMSDCFNVIGYYLKADEGGCDEPMDIIKYGTFIIGLSAVKGKITPSDGIVFNGNHFKAIVALECPVAVRPKQRIGFFQGAKLIVNAKVNDLDHPKNKSDIFDVRECFSAGLQLYDDECFEEARDYFERAEKMGSPDAQYYLSRMYEEGAGTAPDLVKSFELCEKAAVQGDVEAMSYLAEKYTFGDGTGENLEKAFYWYTKAAEKGHTRAQYNLSLMYAEGEGTDPDLIKSFEWCERAAEQGDVEAMSYLAEKYTFGDGTEEDLEKAFCWYSKAAEEGHPEAQYNLSLMYAEGEGTDPNLIKSFEWCRKAAEQGVINAIVSMGEKLYFGEGVPVDKKKAGEWLKKAVDGGNPRAMYMLGHMCYYGDGVPKDEAYASDLLMKASDHGIEEADKLLEKIQ